MGKVRGHPKEQGAYRHAPASPEVVTAGAPFRNGDAGSVPSAWERLRSRELAVKVFVAGATYVALAPFTQLGAIVGVMVSPILSDLVKDYVERHHWSARRLRRRSAAVAVLGHEEEAYAARKRPGRGPGGGLPGALMASVAAVALVVAGVAAANLAKDNGAGGPGHTTPDTHLVAVGQVLGLNGVSPTAEAPFLRWHAVPHASRYVVYRHGKVVDTTGHLYFRDTHAKFGVLNYRVVAEAGDRTGLPSDRRTIVYQATPPPASGITLSGLTPTTQHPSLSWNAPPAAEEYVVYRDDVRIASTPDAGYEDDSVGAGTYAYRVAWISAGGAESHWSKARTIAYQPLVGPPPPPPPPPPSDLTGPKVTADAPVLTWSGGDGADGFTIYRDDQPVGTQTGKDVHRHEGDGGVAPLLRHGALGHG